MFFKHYLELADLHVHGEGVEGHGTYEGDPTGWGPTSVQTKPPRGPTQGSEHVVLPVDPDPLEAGQDVVGVEGLQVPDLHVREPEELQDGRADRRQLQLSWGPVPGDHGEDPGEEHGEDRGEDHQPEVLHDDAGVPPLDHEVGVEGDGEVDVGDLGYVGDVHTDGDYDGDVWRQLELGIVLNRVNLICWFL